MRRDYTARIPIQLVLTGNAREIRVYSCIRAIQGRSGSTCTKSLAEIGAKAQYFGFDAIDRSNVRKAIERLLQDGFLYQIDGGYRCCEPTENGPRDAFTGDDVSATDEPEDERVEPDESVVKSTTATVVKMTTPETDNCGQNDHKVWSNQPQSVVKMTTPAIYTRALTNSINQLSNQLEEGAHDNNSSAEKPSFDPVAVWKETFPEYRMTGQQEIQCEVVKDEATWRKVCEIWAGNDYSPRSVQKAIDCYRNHLSDSRPRAPALMTTATSRSVYALAEPIYKPRTAA